MARVSRQTEDEAAATEGAPEVTTKGKKPPQKKGPAAFPPPPPRSRWKLSLGLMLFVALVVFAPDIVAQTPLKNYLLKAAAPRFPGDATVGRATLSWWKAPVLEEITVTGLEGERLLSVARIAGSKRLFEMATTPTSPGQFTIEQPVLTIVVRPDGSNLEDALRPLMTSRRSGSTRPLNARLEVIEGKIELITDTTRRRTAIEDISLTIDSSTDPEKGIHTQLSADVADEKEKESGKLRVDITWKPGASEAAANADPRLLNRPAPPTPLQGTIRVDGLRLEALDPIWTRIEPTLVVDGDLNADLRLRGLPADNAHPARVGAGGELTVDRLRVACPSQMKSDQLRLARTSLTGGVELTPDSLIADRLKIVTEPAQFDAHGTFPLAALSDPGTWRQFWKTASSEDYSLQANIDVARVAAHLPNVLRLRHDVELTEGRIRASLESYEENGERVIGGNLETSDLNARTAGGPLNWPEPILVQFTSRMTNEGPIVDRLIAKASFLEAAGRGTLRQARVVAKCDLDRFTSDVGRIFDLSEFQLSGRMSADCECKQSDRDADHVVMTGRIGFDDLVWGGPKRAPLREKRLAIEFNAEASMQELRPGRIHTASFRVKGEQDDELVAELSRPVMIAEVADGRGDLPVRLSLVGPLRGWQQRARPWIDFAGLTLEGDADLSTEVLVSGDLITASSIQGTIRALSVGGGEIAVQEQWVQATGTAIWNRKTRELTADDVTLNGSSLSLRSERLSVSLGEPEEARSVGFNPRDGLPSIDGVVTFRGDLDRISRWRRSAPNAPATTLRGMLSGELVARHTGDAMNARFDMRIADFAVTQPSGVAGAASGPGVAAGERSEPPAGRAINSPGAPPSQPAAATTRSLGDLVVTGEADYDRDRDAATLKKLSIISDSLTLNATGSVAAASTEPWAELNGTLEYDWVSLDGVVAALAGDGIRLSGRRSESFSYKGPLSAPDSVTRTEVPVSNVSMPRGGTGSSTPAAQPKLKDFWMRASGHTRFGWQKGDFYGLTTGPVDLDLRLTDGAVRSSPFDIEVSGGRLKGSPVVVLSPGPAMLALDKERVIENVRFTPEMCRTWVKYVAPLLADATEIDGRFTVDLDAARVPLAAPKTADVGGFLIVPQADVRPGPLAEKVLTVARQVEVLLKRRSPDQAGKGFNPLLTLNNQKVEFRLLDGRVHHRNLEIVVDDTIIRTSGSVGLDESLALVVEIPIRDEWVRKDRLLAGLQGQSLRIPIQGTFDRPQLDQRAFQDLASRLATGGVTNTLQDEVSKQLDKLFKRGK